LSVLRADRLQLQNAEKRAVRWLWWLICISFTVPVKIRILKQKKNNNSSC
jgi:hypothetical protein